MTTEDLLKLKKEIDQSTKELSELNGRKKVLLETLKSEFDCTFEDVQQVKDTLHKKVKVLEDEKEEIITKIKDDYEF